MSRYFLKNVPPVLRGGTRGLHIFVCNVFHGIDFVTAIGAALDTVDCFRQGREIQLCLSDAAGIVTHGQRADGHLFRRAAALFGQSFQQGHANEHAIAGLLEINGPGIVIHLHGNFVDPGQGVHDQKIFLCFFQLFGCQNIHAAVALIRGHVGEALFLDTGHVQYIQLRDHGVKIGHFHMAQAMGVHIIDHIVGNGQFPGGNQIEFDVFEPGQGGDQGVDGASVFQVAAQSNAHIVHAAAQMHDGGQIGQGLGGMHVATVAGIDHWHIGIEGSRFCGAFLGGTDHHHIGIAGNHFNSIFQAFTLGHGGGVGVGKAEHAAAQTHHGRLERKVGAGRRFVKQIAGYLAMAGVGISFRMLHNIAGLGIQLVPIFHRQIVELC